MPGRVSRRRIQRLGPSVSRDRSSPFSVLCFLALSINEEGLSSGDDKPCDPYNAARPRVNWILFKGSIREFCLREVGAMSCDFVEVGWRSGLGAGSREVESEIKNKNGAGSRRRRRRGAGERLRCVCWPQRALCDCVALKSARAGSRQKVPRRALRKEPPGDFFSCFLNENEFEIRN